MARKKVVRRKDVIVSICLAVVTLAIMISIRTLFVSPAIAAAGKHQETLRETRLALSAKDQKEGELKRLAKDDAALRAKLSKFEEQIPEKRDLPALFAEVLKLAEDSKLKLIQTKPGEAVAIGQGFHRFACEIELQGGYHDAARFLSSIESHEKFIRIARARVSGSGDGGVKATVVAYLYGSSTASQREMPDPARSGAGKPEPNIPKKRPERPR